MRLCCRTRFDITATGVKSHFSPGRIPFVDDVGQKVSSVAEWNRSRNQQRNWETVNQIIALRTLPENISLPVKTEDAWIFEFTIENPSTIEQDGDPVGALIRDCRDVPMLTGLDEKADVGVCLIPNDNIHFEIVSDK